MYNRVAPVTGLVAEWSCSGLQIRVRRFDSDPSLQHQQTARFGGFFVGSEVRDRLSTASSAFRTLAKRYAAGPASCVPTGRRLCRGTPDSVIRQTDQSGSGGRCRPAANAPMPSDGLSDRAGRAPVCGFRHLAHRLATVASPASGRSPHGLRSSGTESDATVEGPGGGPDGYP